MPSAKRIRTSSNPDSRDESSPTRVHTDDLVWPHIFPYNRPWPEPESYKAGPGMIKKLQSSILKLRIGRELKVVEVHKGILTTAAEYFEKMFNGHHAEASTQSAQFPEDDPAAWGLLIGWCYTEFLPTLHAVETEEGIDTISAEEGLTRIKLCCLAAKYNMMLLHTIAVDSLVKFLGKDYGVKPKLPWDMFRSYCLYVYGYSIESWKSTGSSYDCKKMLELAMEIPDLMSDFSRAIQEQRESTSHTGNIHPSDIDPCEFHIHPKSSDIECPRAFGGKPGSLPWPYLSARLHYMSQNHALKGQSIRNVVEVEDEIGCSRGDIINAVDSLIWQRANIAWLDRPNCFALLPPEEKKGTNSGKQSK
ncbi:uncharacterized protein LY89DRAFT_727557 [Mollisia scopiformis]|uniref:BTB domain-containing protein n=1 Tax=Mollisia scopiformis TaxID=149040 RepID=A0A194XWC4_MOLSC|nr:uncharacterized protein LY89DRAFT_727557 [Mollisia scopiformis]KUJ24533.1 hypothetical protein LY89DRAFT_727557 [Mollisia scopiformis]